MTLGVIDLEPRPGLGGGDGLDSLVGIEYAEREGHQAVATEVGSIVVGAGVSRQRRPTLMF
jgi:hypothetical protein